VDNLTWFAKFLIAVAMIFLLAIGVMYVASLLGLAVSYFHALILTAAARLVPTPW